MNEVTQALLFAPAAGGGSRYGLAALRCRARRRAPRVALAVRCQLRPAGARPPSLSGPLDLHDAIERTTRSAGAAGVVDLLVAALTDRRVVDDREIDRHLDQLKSACRQTRRYRDAITVFARIAVLNGRRRLEMAAEIALAHAHLGRPAEAVALLRSAVAEQRDRPPARREAGFWLVAETAATVLREPALAREIAALAHGEVVPSDAHSPVHGFATHSFAQAI